MDELVRVTEPGGMLVLTNRIGGQRLLFPGKVWGRQRFADQLRQRGCSHVNITEWQFDYDRVLALKQGQRANQPEDRARHARRGWRDLVRCTACSQTAWVEEGIFLHCERCGATMVLLDGIWHVGPVLNGRRQGRHGDI
jgi:hypothetical protein